MPRKGLQNRYKSMLSFGKKDRKKRNEASQTKTVSQRQPLESDFLTVVAYFEKISQICASNFPF